MIRRLHLITGLILFSYLLTHLLNHALGLISLDALEAGRRAFLALWRNPPMTALLLAALVAHLGLGLRAVFRRRSLRMPVWEAAQIALGFTIPPLLVLHVLGTRIAHELYGVEDNYVYILLVYFVFSPVLGVKQAVVLLVAWVHACIGLHFWLRIRPWYPRVQPYAFALALLLPAFSLAGVVTAGREVTLLAGTPGWMAAAREQINFPDAEDVALLYALDTWFIVGVLGLLALVLLACWARVWYRQRGLVHVTYPDGRRVPIAIGTTLPEASRGAGIPHASVCGGRGRCSTCRVQVGAGAEQLPSPSEAEARVLLRVGAAPKTPLACQTRPQADVEITPLLPAAAGPREAAAAPRHRQGEEREVAILFADLRGFTTLAEQKLPYDVVFVLNRYFAAMGAAVEESGGRVDKFIGDGVMALFGVDQGIEAGCRGAVTALDLSEDLLAQARRLAAEDGVQIETLCAPAEETGLPDQAFDVVSAGQCWHWFDRAEAAQEARRLLAAGGRLLICHFDWLPLPGTVVAATEHLIEAHNPAWTMGGGDGLHPAWLGDASAAGFTGIESFSFDVSVPYGHEAWRGRVRASAGVGGSLPDAEVAAFDHDLAACLVKQFPEDPLQVPHRAFAMLASAP